LILGLVVIQYVAEDVLLLSTVLMLKTRGWQKRWAYGNDGANHGSRFLIFDWVAES
jgi:hypothetical protein